MRKKAREGAGFVGVSFERFYPDPGGCVSVVANLRVHCAIEADKGLPDEPPSTSGNRTLCDQF